MDTPVYDVNLEQFEEPARSVVKSMLAKLEPTEEDIKRVLSEDELKELCRKVKCRVDAFRWNPVEDYNRYFKRRNRFVGKSPLEQRQLLAKAVNRYYHIKWKFNEEEMRKERRKEWIIQKKNNLLSLDLWAYERQKEAGEQTPVLQISDSENSESLEVLQPTQMPEIQRRESEEEEYEEILPDIQPTQMPDIQSQESVHRVPPSPLVQMTQQVEEDEEEESDESSLPAGVRFVISESLEDDVPEPNSEEQIYMDKESVNINSEELQKRGIPDKHVVKMFQVNTDSLTLTSEFPESQSITDYNNGVHSQDVIHDYDDFDIGVPQTSTQSQGVSN
ncbi:telomere-binding protein cav [Musca vetustissima]|uniref:telomere-binding protein cav n=1 Tax=Musca vetustissima TaxID=27455 RepID=UPI002AB75C8B|nr:telomere-binding protein cav [Musca vetustissima]